MNSENSHFFNVFFLAEGYGYNLGRRNPRNIEPKRSYAVTVLNGRFPKGGRYHADPTSPRRFTALGSDTAARKYFIT
jgi:hypothetical protein